MDKESGWILPFVEANVVRLEDHFEEMDSGDGAQEREDEGISEEGNRHDAGASSPSRSSSDVRRTLTAVNMFVSQTAEFLNAFAQRCDEKLGALQYKIKAVGMQHPSP